MLSVRGIFREGRIEIPSQVIKNHEPCEVIVTFMETQLRENTSDEMEEQAASPVRQGTIAALLSYLKSHEPISEKKYDSVMEVYQNRRRFFDRNDS